MRKPVSPIQYDHTHERASRTADGFMSRFDKAILDDIGNTYYTKTELAGGILDSRYFTETETTTAITNAVNAIYSDSGTYRQYLGKAGSTSAYITVPSSGALPSSNGTGSLGTSSIRWASVYANAFYLGSGADPLVAILGQETTNPFSTEYSDGTIIKFATGALDSMACSTAAGGLYRLSADQTVTFDTSFAFATEPVVFCIIKNSSYYMWAVIRTVSTTTFTFNILSTASVGTATPWQFRYFAIGR